MRDLLLVRLWTDFLSHTQPALSGSLLIVIAQMAAGTVTPILVLLRSVRRREMGETLLLCVVPLCLLATAGIVEPLLFGCFLGGGFPWTDALRDFLHQPRFFQELLGLCGAYCLLAALFFRMDRRLRGEMTTGRLLVNTGAELLVIALSVLFAKDCRWGTDRLFLSLGGAPLKWFVYGVYLLAARSGFYLLCLVWNGLFGERPRRQSDTCARRLRRELTGPGLVRGVSMGLLSLLCLLAVIRPLVEEGSTRLAALMAALSGLLLVWGLWGLAAAVFPGLNAQYRRIRRWGDLEETARSLYEELALRPAPSRSGTWLLTEHYLMILPPKGRWIGGTVFRRDLLLPPKLTARGTALLSSQDGGRCLLDRSSEPLLRGLFGYSPWEG